ncbi:hypothetical protein AOG1_26420 [Geobacter sp. AOG1]|nr:hypothetical protein AOG1_26420 [Geobacter sp. AOG1]
MKRVHLTVKPLLCLMLLLLSACAVTEPLVLRDPSVNLAWPPPPNPPRISFLRDVKGPVDVLPEKGNLARFMEFVTGEDTTKMVLNTPYGVASNGDSIIYATDIAAGVVHRYDLAKRTVVYITQAGEEPLIRPGGVAVDQDGNVYISDAGSAKVFKFDKNGDFIHELAGQFQRPAGIAINSRGEKFVVDVLAHKLKVFDVHDTFIRNFPRDDTREPLNLPSNVAIGRNDDVYVTDSMNFMVKVFDQSGSYKSSIGEIGDAPGSFARPKGVAVDTDDHIYIVDASHGNFQVFNRDGKLLLFVGRNGAGPGEFSLPSGISIDSKGRIFVADTYNHRIQIFQYMPEGGPR